MQLCATQTQIMKDHFPSIMENTKENNVIIPIFYTCKRSRTLDCSRSLTMKKWHGFSILEG